LKRFSAILTITLVTTLSVPSLAFTAPQRSFMLEETTVDEVHRAFADGTLTCELLVRGYLNRIEAYENSGPAINTLISIAPNAMEQAAALDRAYRRSGPVGALHCIPVVLKDNIDTTDMPTTAGSQTLANDLPVSEAFITTRLREAGAIVLAKGNLDEWAHGGAGGYSSTGGRSFNPYDLGSPSGSSGGPAAAVAANFAILGVGTDTLGSIRGPVQTNRLAGMKPTSGLVSGTGVVPFALTFDAAGPMTRTVTDSARLLNVLAGVDPDDSRTLAAAGRIPDDYTDLLTTDALVGVRIGVIATYYNAADPVLAQVLDDLEAAGAEIVMDIEAPQEIRTLSTQFYQLISETEFVAQLGDYLAERRPDAIVRSHADVYAAALRPDSLIAPQVLVRLERESTRGTLEDPAYLEAVAFAPATMRDGIDQMLETHEVDVLLHTGASQLANFSGYPSMIVQAGVQPTGSPVAIQFLGEPFSEDRLLAYAYAYEQATRHRVQAQFTPALTLENAAACRKGGWKWSTSPIFGNQGMCLSTFTRSGQ
jgi:amidase